MEAYRHVPLEPLAEESQELTVLLHAATIATRELIDIKEGDKEKSSRLASILQNAINYEDYRALKEAETLMSRMLSLVAIHYEETEGERPLFIPQVAILRTKVLFDEHAADEDARKRKEWQERVAQAALLRNGTAQE